MGLEIKNPQRLAGYLALSALVAVVLAPPEAFGSGRMMLVVTATFAFLIASVAGGVPTSYLAGGSALLGLLIAHSLWLSEDFYRSLDFLGLAWAYYCLFGVVRHSPDDLRRKGCVVLVLLASCVSIYGLYQYLWGFDALSAFVDASQADLDTRTSILNRLAGARVFATFALPGTLWGFLILAIPLHAPLWPPESGWRRAALAGNIALLVTVAALTQSYGFVLGLATVIAGWAVTQPSRRPVRSIALGSLVGLPIVGAIAGAIYLTRAASHNPVWLRLQNWRSAWEIFISHPLGSGLNTYAVLYPQHQQPGANETQFAHNTLLQLTAELGIFALILLIPVVWVLFPRIRVAARSTRVERSILVGLMVWGVHNLMDINVYFGSLGAIGAVLLGLLAWTPEPRESFPVFRAMRRPALGITGALAAVALVSSGMMYLSGEFLYRARIELEFQRISEAAATLRSAASINPFDSSIMHEAGQTEFELYYATDDLRHLDAARNYFQKAIDLSPLKVGPHIGLALCFSSRDQTEQALAQLEIAGSLHPGDAQVGAIRRLVENRHAELEDQGSGTP